MLAGLLQALQRLYRHWPAMPTRLQPISACRAKLTLAALCRAPACLGFSVGDPAEHFAGGAWKPPEPSKQEKEPAARRNRRIACTSQTPFATQPFSMDIRGSVAAAVYAARLARSFLQRPL